MQMFAILIRKINLQGNSLHVEYSIFYSLESMMGLVWLIECEYGMSG
jgi:hypothetical protein